MAGRLYLGCIADDFTGAGDAASFIAAAGTKTLLLSGIPGDETVLEGCESAVIALKTRTQERAAAIQDSLSAAAFLRAQGATQLYIKYCSTFDSTPQGNIGPILDALLEAYDIPYTLLCPSLPVNGRTVTDGKLYVNGIPLHESPMRNHPLTPMWDCDLERLMAPQSKYPCLKLGRLNVTDREQIMRRIQDFSLDHPHFYLIPDYDRPEDADTIAALFGHLPLLSGGSGLLTALANLHRTDSAESAASPQAETGGSALLLAGSCSEATRTQIAAAKAQGIPSIQMDPEALLAGTQTEAQLLSFICQSGKTALVYSSDTPDAVQRIQRMGRDKISALLEGTTASLAKAAMAQDIRRFIIAGGETSGAVTRALGFDAYHIRESVAPGVPVMIPVSRPDIRLVLKSGNFGGPDFFLQALQKTEV